jgi:hypothetical protein
MNRDVPPGYVPDPNHPGKSIVTGAPRYLHTFSCMRCGLTYGTEEHEEAVPEVVCPVCQRPLEFTGTTDRAQGS